MAAVKKPTLRSALADARKALDALDTLPETVRAGPEGERQKEMVDTYLAAVARLQALAEPRTRALGGRVQEAHDALRQLDDLPANPGELTADHIQKLDLVTRATERVGNAGKIKDVSHPLPAGPIPPAPRPRKKNSDGDSSKTAAGKKA